MTILAITEEDDEHLPFVQRHLDEEITIINPYKVSRGQATLTLAHKNGQQSLTYGNVTISDVRSVWYRKPPKLELDKLDIIDEYRTYVTSAINRHVKLIKSLCQDAFWLSDFYNIQRAGSKDYQLSLASSIGFNVPSTILTSDPRAAKEFLKIYRPAIVKSLSSEFPGTETSLSFFFAKKITDPESISLTNLHLAPAIFQEAIDAVMDLRITVVGDKVFAASIESDSEKRHKGVRDWRFEYRHGGNLFKPYNLDVTTKKRCVELVERLGLRYGAIDLLVDRTGKVWFLEINPNGQWAFVEEDTDLPIGKTIAGVLSSGRV